ncbi:tetratricopeptide repeat protein [Parasulfitobacter algicola]|uniref:Sel1 repeat family protein n=1 Tax=Parasulfitobacter algicola TaxID=2614809 RepID=A0ABX2IZM7_9RHOB|nr:tetratricopeptide repeat protein [Sulfitobacter algicola]NSX56226.1 sel1 repeat family protein [Sulfitobacter algicola]
MRLMSLIVILLAWPAFADVQTVEDDAGTLNPQDTGIGMLKRKIELGMTDMVTCSMGYYVTKSGNHDLARKFFQQCADAGYPGAMTWMSQMENNGLGGDYDPDASAEWDRRAAETGDPVGKFNYGLNLLRGHGVPQDKELGQNYVDQAAADGLPIAKRLQGAGYDPDEVTPDADNWKYAPLF